MLNCNKKDDCNYKCNCVDKKIQETVMPETEMTENRECTKDCKREEIMMKIKELNFAVIELGLYLDTHPEDKKALCLHNHYSKDLKELKDKYEKMYGPLTIYYPCNKWRWLEEPWPWERGNF